MKGQVAMRKVFQRAGLFCFLGLIITMPMAMFGGLSYLYPSACFVGMVAFEMLYSA